MSDFGVTCSIEEGIGKCFNLSSTDSNSVSVDLMDVSVEENFCIASRIVFSEVMSEHPQLDTTKIGTHHNLTRRCFKEFSVLMIRRDLP